MQRPVVEDEAVVTILTAQHLAEPGMLLGHFRVSPRSQLGSQLFQLANHPRRLRLLWSPQTRLRSSLSGEPPELDQPGLALAERQPELGRSLSECSQQLPRVAFILDSRNYIVGIANDHDLATRVPGAPLVYPGIRL
jgi:hypothetical protein